MSEGQRVLNGIRRLVRQLRITDRAAQQLAGVSAAQLFVLSELGKTPNMSLGELARRTVTDQSSVSAVVTRLVETGLVMRRRAGDDARRLVLSVTRTGRAALKKAPAVAQEQILEAVEKLPPADRKKFADTLQLLLDSMGIEEDAPMIFEEEARTSNPARRREAPVRRRA